MAAASWPPSVQRLRPRAIGLVSGLERSCLHNLILCCPGSFGGPGCLYCRCGARTAGRSRPPAARAGSASTPTASFWTCGCWSAVCPAIGRASSPCTSEHRSGPSIRPSSTATMPAMRNWWRPGCWSRCSFGATASPWTGRAWRLERGSSGKRVAEAAGVCRWRGRVDSGLLRDQSAAPTSSPGQFADRDRDDAGRFFG